MVRGTLVANVYPVNVKFLSAVAYVVFTRSLRIKAYPFLHLYPTAIELCSIFFFIVFRVQTFG